MEPQRPAGSIPTEKSITVLPLIFIVVWAVRLIRTGPTKPRSPLQGKPQQVVRCPIGSVSCVIREPASFSGLLARQPLLSLSVRLFALGSLP